jgi:hypothetical protein
MGSADLNGNCHGYAIAATKLEDSTVGHPKTSFVAVIPFQPALELVNQINQGYTSIRRKEKSDIGPSKKMWGKKVARYCGACVSTTKCQNSWRSLLFGSLGAKATRFLHTWKGFVRVKPGMSLYRPCLSCSGGIRSARRFWPAGSETRLR